MLSRANDILEPMFVRDVLPAEGHGLLATQDGWEQLLSTLPPAAEPVRVKLLEIWTDPHDQSTPAHKWKTIKKHLNIFIGKKEGTSSKVAKHMSSTDRVKIEMWPVETVFKYTYPRLDINVSKMRNHLLKSPFCVHPKTGRVCVPIEVEKIENFDPFAVPTLPVLMKELDEKGADNVDLEEAGGRPTGHDWKSTSLRGYFEPFQKGFLIPMMQSLKRSERRRAEDDAAAACDF